MNLFQQLNIYEENVLVDYKSNVLIETEQVFSVCILRDVSGSDYIM